MRCIRTFFHVGMDSLKGGENVAIRDYWVFQERQVATPWALYIVKEYETPQTFDNTCLDVTIYHEDIDNDEHALSFVCWRFDTISGYTDEIQWHLSKYTLFNADDYKQVDRAIFQIFMDK